MSAEREGLPASFLDRVAFEPMSGCWLWTASTRGKGYGKLNVDGQEWGAHRYAYAVLVGPIPKGVCVCHACDTPLCVNPDHLWLGTIADNNADKKAKGRGCFGQRNGGGKLLRVEVEEMIARRHAGELQVALADEYGIHEDTVGKIMRGVTWKHLNRPWEA